MKKENESNRKESILAKCIITEKIIMYLYYNVWLTTTDKYLKKECFMSIHDSIFKTGLLEKQWSGKISEAALNNPTNLSKDHDIRRKNVAEDIFVNFDKYGFTGDGKTYLNIVENLTFSYVDKIENRPFYDDNKVNKIDITKDKMKKVKKVCRLKNKGILSSSYVINPDDYDKVSLVANYKDQCDFYRLTH